MIDLLLSPRGITMLQLLIVLLQLMIQIAFAAVSSESLSSSEATSLLCVSSSSESTESNINVNLTYTNSSSNISNSSGSGSNDGGSIIQTLRDYYERDGYIVLPGLLSVAEVEALTALVNDELFSSGPPSESNTTTTTITRSLIGPRFEADSSNYNNNMNGFGYSYNYYNSDISKHPTLRKFVDILHSKKELHTILSQAVFGCGIGEEEEEGNDPLGSAGTSTCYEALPRNDFIVDCASATSNWHRDRPSAYIAQHITIPEDDIDIADIEDIHTITVKDDEIQHNPIPPPTTKLQNDDRSNHNKYRYHIVNVGYYLEDHTNDEEGLWIVPGSHKIRTDRGYSSDDIEAKTAIQEGKLQQVPLHSGIGDVIVWNYKTYHIGGRGHYYSYEHDFERCSSNSNRDTLNADDRIRGSTTRHPHRVLLASTYGLSGSILTDMMIRVLQLKYATASLDSQSISLVSGCNGTTRAVWRECSSQYIQKELQQRPLSIEQQQVHEYTQKKRLLAAKERQQEKQEGCSPTASQYENVEWNSLPFHVQVAASQLGYNREIWDNGSCLAIERTKWKDLSNEERRLLRVMDYNGSSW